MQSLKNKLLIGVIVLLVIANVASITMMWLNNNKHPHRPNAMQAAEPKMFLINELQLNAQQQQQLDTLVKEHRGLAKPLKDEIRETKRLFFNLLQQKNIADSTKQNALKAISKSTEALDVVAFNHFAKVRLICNEAQQKRFDEIIDDVTKLMAQPPRHKGNHDDRPPFPPPPNKNDDN
jgi:periplasmic protein CpxP/Spy